MAKDSDHLANGFDADNTGGVLSGLLAEEDELDRRALWRIGSWGVGAVGAVVVAVMANQSSLGLKREQMAAVDLARQAQQIQMTSRETLSETRRLASAIDTLNGDRDRLYTRVTSLEQGLDSVTGSFIRQVSPAGTPPAPTALITEPQTTPNPGPAPSVAPVGTIPPAPEKPMAKATVPEPSPATISSFAKDAPKTDAGKAERVEAAKSELAKINSAKPELPKIEPPKVEIAKADASKLDIVKPDNVKPDVAKLDVAKPPAATPATPLVAAKSLMAPPDPAAAKLIEPGRPASSVTASPIPEVVAPVATDEEADEATAPKVALHRTEFGVDLGSANSVGGLRAMWRGLLKSRSNAPLAALRPIIMIKEGSNGLGMQLHLVAGPLNDAGAAAKICAVMTENDRKCETTIFDGQRLTLNSGDATPTAAKPASSHKRGASKRAAAAAVAEEPPPKKPETTSSISSSISSMFGRKSSQ